MYRLLIVDDESAIRKGLSNFINWSSIDCEIVGEAVNGIDAIEKVKSLSPDIVITDIKMPGMNGIELSEYIYKNHSEIQVIILTGYADFTFAQSAIKFGVVEFVLKPTSKEKIIEAASAAIKNISDIREKEKDIIKLKNIISETLPEAQGIFLQNVINGLVSENPKILIKAAELGIDLGNYYILAFEVDKVEQEANSANFSTSILSLKNMLSLAYKDYSHYIFSVNHKRICIVLDFKSIDTLDCLQLILNSCDEILQMINTFMNFSVSIGISKMHHSPSDLQSAYFEADTAITNKFYSDSQISIYSEKNISSKTKDLLHSAFIDNVLTNVQNGLISEAVDTVINFYDIQKEERLPIEHIKSISIQLYSLCSRLLLEHNTSLDSLVEDGQNIYKKIMQSKTIGELTEITIVVVKNVSKYINKPDKPQNIIIQKSLEYINQNYKSELTLQMIADHVHVNSSYLSRLFRKDTGETVIDTITKIRVEKAKELLSNQNIKAYEVAYMVGIEDPPYFSQVFKKYTGLSPKEYKNQKT